MIFVITNSLDKTVDYIVEKYSGDYDFFRLDVDLLYEYEIDFSSDYGLRIVYQNERILIENEISSIYYRKIIFTDIPGFDSKYYGFQRSEVYSFIKGFVNQFQKKVLTKPTFLNFADNKIVQLQKAKHVGLNVPPTHITNSVDIVQEFGDPLIVKPIVRGKIQDGQTIEIIHTNKLNKMYDMQTLKYCPTIFQKYIRKEYEIRLTVIVSFPFN
jgi:glutathione synthase/RimK-type ligase-like ATP-grasp enzyme